MSMREFIKQNKEEIDAAIRKLAPEQRISNEERRLWVLNDYGLYLMAKRSGVRV